MPLLSRRGSGFGCVSHFISAADSDYLFLYSIFQRFHHFGATSAAPCVSAASKACLFYLKFSSSQRACSWPFLFTSDEDQIASQWRGVRKEQQLGGGKRQISASRRGRWRVGEREKSVEASQERLKRELSLWVLLLLQPALAVRGPEWTLTSLPAAWGSG